MGRKGQLDALALKHLVDRRDRVERAREADEGRQLVHSLADLDWFDAHVEGGGRVGLQLRQRLQADQHGDGDQSTGAVVEHPGVEHVAENEPAQDFHQLRIVVGRTAVARSEQSLVGGLGVSLTLGHLGALLIGRHDEQPFAGDEHLVKDQLCTGRSTNGSPVPRPECVPDSRPGPAMSPGRH